MRQNDLSGFPRLVDDLDALHEEITFAVKWVYIAFGAVMLPRLGIALYTLGTQ